MLGETAHQLSASEPFVSVSSISVLPLEIVRELAVGSSYLELLCFSHTCKSYNTVHGTEEA